MAASKASAPRHVAQAGAAVTRRGLRRVLFAALLSSVAWLSSCLSPTLPLPPPGEPDGIEETATGWKISGDCLEGAQVVVLNEALGKGAVVIDLDGNGRFVAELEGEPCDVIVITQSLGDDASPETRAVLTETQNGAAVDPDACK